MVNFILRCCFVLMCCLAALTSTATNYYISDTGNNNSDGLTITSAILDVQELISRNNLMPGDSVLVLEGAHKGFNASNFQGMNSGEAGKPIVFKGLGNQVKITSPISSGDGIRISSVSHLVIDGFIINEMSRNGIIIVESDFIEVRNNFCDGNVKRGIFTGCSSNLLVEHNIASNSEEEHGCYISNSGDNHIIRNNIFRNNNGAGLQINADLNTPCVPRQTLEYDGIITGAEVYDNIIYANGIGGGAALNFDGAVGVKCYNNLLYNNLATGIAIFGADAAEPSNNAFVANNTIINGSPNKGRWAVLVQANDVTFLNNYVWNNHSTKGSLGIESWAMPTFKADFNLLDGKIGLDGDNINSIVDLSTYQQEYNKDQNSKLAPAPSKIFINPNEGDFYLKESSIAIDEGTDMVSEVVKADLVGNPRPQGQGYDIGAYELLPEQPVNSNLADLGTCITGTLIAPSDIGRFEFDGWKAGDIVFVSVSSSSSIRPKVTARLNGNQIAVYDENSFVAEIISEPLQESGTISIFVEDLFTDNDGQYNLFVERLNQPISAQSIVCDETKSTNIECSSMSNFLKFSGKAEAKVQINANSDSSVRSCLKIYNADGKQEAIQCANAFNAQIEFTLPKDGCYYIALSDESGRNSGEGTLSLIRISGECTEDCSQIDIPIPLVEKCNNQIDDDGDGKIDCDDGDCATNINCEDSNSSGQFTLVLDELEGEPLDTVLVAVRAEFMEQIAGLTHSLVLADPAIGAIIGLEDGTLKGVDFSLKSETLMTVGWTEPSGVGLSLPNGTVLYYIKVVLKNNNAGACTSLSFEDAPTIINATQILNEETKDVKPLTVDGQVCLLDKISLTVITKMETGESVAAVAVDCNGDTLLTTVFGKAVFEKEIGESCDLILNKDTNPLNGVTTLDAVLILKHILDDSKLTSPYAILAADVDGNGIVTITDVVLIRQLIITKINAFPNPKIWQFVPTDFQFESETNPLATDIPVVKTVTVIEDTQVDFIAIKTGDVNNSASPNTLVNSLAEERSAFPVERYNVPSKTLIAGEIIELPFQLAFHKDIQAFQSAIKLDTRYLELVEITSPLDKFGKENWYIHPENPDLVNIAWYSNNINFLEEGSPVFTLKISVKRTVDLDKALSLSNTKANLVYPSTEQEYQLKLNFYDVDNPGKTSLIHVAPNPFSRTVSITFNNPATGATSLELHDITGRLIYETNSVLPKGEKSWNLNAELFNQAGIYFYRIKNEQDTYHGQLIYHK